MKEMKEWCANDAMQEHSNKKKHTTFKELVPLCVIFKSMITFDILLICQLANRTNITLL